MPSTATVSSAIVLYGTMHAKDSETKMHVSGCHHRLLNTLQSMLRQRKIGSKEKFMVYTARAHTVLLLTAQLRGKEGGRKHLEKAVD